MMLIRRSTLVLGLSLMTTSSYANPLPAPTSYEFKQLLPTSAFQSSQAILDYQQALIAQLAPFGDLSGQLQLKEQGAINFYDTKGCRLNQQGLLLRHRLHHDQWQLTLKLRNINRQLLSESPLMATGELQADVLAKPKRYTIYSITSSQPIDKVPLHLALLAQSFPALAQLPKFNALGSLALLPLSKPELQQAVYKGLSLKLGQHKLKFSLTFWSKTPQGTPSIAEISFEISNKKHKLNNDALQTADLILDKIAQMPAWKSSIDSTKTQWVYQHASSLCQQNKRGDLGS